MAELLRVHRAMDWPWVVHEARRLHSRRILWLGLLLAHDLLQALLPEYLVHQAREDVAARSLAALVCGQLFREDGDGIRSAFFHLQARECWRDGFRYTLSLALAPTVADWEYLALPASCSFLYPLLRMIRLAGKYSHQLLGWSVTSAATRTPHAADRRLPLPPKQS